MAQPKPVFARIENQTEVEDKKSKGVAVGKTVKSKGKLKLKQAQEVAGA